MPGLKFIEGSEIDIEGTLAPWGGPFNGQDLAGEHFSVKTNFCLDWFPSPATRPLLWHHGLDGEIKTSVVGRIGNLEVKTDTGLWMQAQLDANNEYYDAIKQLIKQGKVGLSSGSMSHLVEVNSKSGEILLWPVVEGSITPTPCNPIATVDLVTAKAHFKAIGSALPAKLLQEGDDTSGGFLTGNKPKGKAELTTDQRKQLDDSDYAYIDSDGGKHLPINDAAHVRNAIARFDQTKFEDDSAKASARKKILAKAKELGVDVSDDSMKSARKAGACVCCCHGCDCCDPGAPDESCDCCCHGCTCCETAGGYKAASIKTMEGSYEDLLEDLNALINPRSPFGGVDYWTYIVATFPDYFICCRRDYDEDEQDYYRCEYTLDAEGEPVLGACTEVEETFVPVQEEDAEIMGMPVAIHSATVTKYAAALAARTKGLHERRIKEGRTLSGGNRKNLEECLSQMKTACDALQSLLDSTVPQPAKAATVRQQFRFMEMYATTL